ncbi:MAG: hypothetical protein GEV09_22595 [Pseudonocardiaceae bacterium]|nr:hypothetical protein [Pseudonocardiaceae bacterium]
MDNWRGPGITGPVTTASSTARTVWLQLDIAYPPPERRRSVAEGLDLRGRVPAVLLRWVRSHDGAWLGLLGRVELCDGAGDRRLVLEQLLVPADALSPREPPPR